MLEISEKRAAANRANGALSRGPKTPEGKAISSQNSLKHGILAKCLLLPHEDPEAFGATYQSYMARLEPTSELETALVEDMLSAHWRLRRTVAAEMRTLATEMQSHAALTELDSLAQTFGDAATHPKLNLLLRYQTRFHLMQSRCIRDLAVLRRQFPPAPTVPNEPISPNVSNTEPEGYTGTRS